MDDRGNEALAMARPGRGYGLWLCAALIAWAVGCARPAAKPPGKPPKNREATVLLHNGVIFTARDARETVSALALAGRRVLAVGTERDLRGLVGASTRVVDLRGRFVCPGFHDAHLHFEGGGRSLATLNLAGLRSLDAVLAAIKREVARTEAGTWVAGRGWDHTLWPGQAWPRRQDLDRVAPDHPVSLRRVCGHASWVNSAALRAAKITAETPDPAGGEIAREADGRTPTGILKESAVQLAEPRITAEDSRRFLELALAEARRLGVTSVQDAGGANFEQLARLHDEGKLTVRVYAMGDLDEPLAQHEARRRRFPRGGALLSYAALKGYVDGALGAGTAALLEPYADAPDKRGILVTEEPKLEERVRAATRAGFQVALHAIGDRGVRIALRAFEAALPDGARALRHRVEHAQLVHPDDLALFERSGAIASVQPCHLITDQRWVAQRVGAARAGERGYPWRTLAEHAPLALGTDWPVEPLSPLRNLYAAVTRKLAEPPVGEGFHPEQRLSIGEALRAYSVGGAHAAFAEDRRGTLEPGRDADLVILDRNLLTVPPQQILEARVLATVLGGRVVHGNWE